MKTKKIIVNFILLAGLAVALTACGQSTTALKNGRVPPPSAAGTAASPLQGYWQGTCGAYLLNSEMSYQFNGSTFKQYQDIYNSSDCSDDYPSSTVEVDGTFQLANEGAEIIQLTPNNGQAPIQDVYSLNGTTLSIESMSSNGTTSALQTFMLYTGN
jgi:hypothetical protein